jgi:activator of HSP90 ATPase
MTKTIRQTATFSASPHAVYEALMDARKHAKFTGAPATTSRKVGGAFTAYGGALSGTNLELIPDKKIVQAWRADDWPAGHFSRATFALKNVKSGTQLSFYQSGVPDKEYAGVKQGWVEHYWTPMRKMLHGGK